MTDVRSRSSVKTGFTLGERQLHDSIWPCVLDGEQNSIRDIALVHRHDHRFSQWISSRTHNHDFLRAGYPPIQRAEHRCRTMGILCHRLTEQVENLSGSLIIPLLAREREEP